MTLLQDPTQLRLLVIVGLVLLALSVLGLGLLMPNQNNDPEALLDEDTETLTLKDDKGVSHDFTVLDVITSSDNQMFVLMGEVGDEDSIHVFKMEGDDRLVPATADEVLMIAKQLEENLAKQGLPGTVMVGESPLVLPEGA